MTQKNFSQKASSHPKKSRVLLDFLGSMNLAVTLLVMLSIASVIGTVLQQNQTFQDYIIKFGPFWADVFNSLGLYHVYGAAWFVLVLVFLLLSTSVCVTRNTPTFLKDMKQFSEKLSVNALKHQPNHATFESTNSQQTEIERAQALLKTNGYKTKVHHKDDGGVTVAGLKGRWNRLGYFFTHISIIVICVGALLDSNLLLKYRELTGDLIPETRTVSLDKVEQTAWMGPENLSFRGSVNVPEGQKTDVLFLPYENGYLVQKLPFSIDVKDFRIEYYDTGMPKSYESDLILTAPELDEPIVKTIAVNHPLYYKNYAIYQSSFGDGGSILNLDVHPLLSPIENVMPLETAVNKVEPLKTPIGKFRVEINDFRLFNMVPTTEEEKAQTGKKFHNNGPSIIFKVRNEQGKAWEYENYMMPSLQEDRWFFMTGVRTINSEPFRYLFIPADANKTKTRFFQFLALVNNPVETSKILRDAFPKTEQITDKTYELQIKLMQQLMNLFRAKGFEGITEFVNKNVPEKEREQVAEYYFSQSSFALQSLYLTILQKEGVKLAADQDISDFDKIWFEDALNAFNGLSRYGPPMYFELKSFKQIQATGLQITKSPGKDVVYFGSAMLIIGVFFLFYVRQKRIWIHIQPNDEHENNDSVEITVAGKDNKPLPETEIEFNELVKQIQQPIHNPTKTA
ncbi:MAG: cytochrome c biogenesis protein ResB [Thiomicrorhabdus chilensis]|uniref:cytochrome c biogenesis protein ResB n=1 Tax=Thiomicrorhabdus chilensis TaxID=63656 RepID=UPI00299DF92B|nr:cytochrome c biogenesis protein ResB [Thiomicrorhabdus chilensis]MDX1348039.1 cytochrome c biogenesis protein ResB [Thiomicrorhabdus chilensis]